MSLVINNISWQANSFAKSLEDVIKRLYVLYLDPRIITHPNTLFYGMDIIEKHELDAKSYIYW